MAAWLTPPVGRPSQQPVIWDQSVLSQAASWQTARRGWRRRVKTGGRLVTPARDAWRLLAEGHLTRRLFASLLGRIAGLPVPTGEPGRCSRKIESGGPGTSGV